MLEIKKLKDSVLYKTARPVGEDEFGPELDKFMSDMAVTMYASNGTGLAGPQVGSDLRVLVMDVGYLDYREYGSEFIKVVNPTIVSVSEDLSKAEEQCLSYPDLSVIVQRPNQVTVSYYTPLGEKKELSYKDWQARVILHEMDHLDGVTLYTRAGTLTKKKYDKKLGR